MTWAEEMAFYRRVERGEEVVEPKVRASIVSLLALINRRRHKAEEVAT